MSAALAHTLTAALALWATVAGGAGVLGATWTWSTPLLVPLGGLELAMDPLAGLFLVIIGATTLPVLLYAAGAAPRDTRGALALLGFVATMAAVPLAANVVTFVLAWELMALASYLLVLDGAAAPGHAGSEGAGAEAAEAARAAWVYAVMTHAGLACLLGGMLLLGAHTGSLRFVDWRGLAATLPAGTRDGAFLLLALGFAGKAGLMPLHVWLPLAHPAAPSHVSALMSGVMIKLGLYGLARAAFEWLAPLPAGWGVAVMIVGAISAAAGILYAVVERDIKRLLAFSSIENVGVIAVALGATLVFQASGQPALAVLALAAALYHTVNHAAFKGLLFLAAGALTHSAGTRDLDAMGGLIKRMPWTGACFLLASLAVAAMPPLNGFVSEWLIFQALLQNVRIPAPPLNLAFTAGLACLALTAGITIACFVKASGTALLALPRSAGAAAAREVGPARRAAMIILAVACAGLGAAAWLIVPRLAYVAARLTGGPGAWPEASGLAIALPGDFARLSMPVVTLALGLGFAVPALVLAWRGRAGGRRPGETWGCGRILQTARMEYTATAFSNPFARVFDFVYRSEQARVVDAHPSSRLYVRAIHYRHESRAVVEDYLYRPLGRGLRALTARVRLLQSGSANVYLAYILAALLVLLVLA